MGETTNVLAATQRPAALARTRGTWPWHRGRARDRQSMRLGAWAARRAARLARAGGSVTVDDSAVGRRAPAHDPPGGRCVRAGASSSGDPLSGVAL
jgi:hypothetical protein